MSEVKEAVKRMLDRLPDDCSYEDIQYHLFVIQKIRQGLDDVRAGRFKSQEEIERKVEEWAKSYGLEPQKTILTS